MLIISQDADDDALDSHKPDLSSDPQPSDAATQDDHQDFPPAPLLGLPSPSDCHQDTYSVHSADAIISDIVENIVQTLAVQDSYQEPDQFDTRTNNNLLVSVSHSSISSQPATFQASVHTTVASASLSDSVVPDSSSPDQQTHSHE